MPMRFSRLTIMLAAIAIAAIMATPTHILGGHAPARRSSGGPPINIPAVKRFKLGHRHPESKYSDDNYSNPVSPDVDMSKVYQPDIKPDPFFETVKPTREQKARIEVLIEKISGVRSEDRRAKAALAVDELVKLGECAALKISQYAEGDDAQCAMYCLQVMDKAWLVRYQPILLHLLDTRAAIDKNLGQLAVDVLLRHVDSTATSGLLRVLLEENNPAFVKDVCRILWKCQTPDMWQKVFQIAGIKTEDTPDPNALMELREPAARDAIAGHFLKGADAAANAEVVIGRAKRPDANESLAAELCAVVLAWTPRPQDARALAAMRDSTSSEVAFYAAVGQARLGDVQCLPRLIANLESEQWNQRRDAELALLSLTGTRLNFDFSDDREGRIRGIVSWKNHQALKDAAAGADAVSEADGWKKVPMRFVTIPKPIDFSPDKAIAAFGSGDYQTPGLLEGRMKIITFVNGVARLPLLLSKGRTVLLKSDETKTAVSMATLEAVRGTPAFQPLVFAGKSTKPFNLELNYHNEAAVPVAYCLGEYDKASNTIALLRAGYFEGQFQGGYIRVYDDNNNGDFNDYGADAIQIAGRKYATLLSSTVELGGNFYELRINRPGTVCWLKPYKGALGTVVITPPKNLNTAHIQVQSGSRVLDVTAATSTPQRLPAGTYQIVHAVVGKPPSQAVITRGEQGFFEVQANKVTLHTFAEKLTLNFNPELRDECDICSLKSKYPVAKGGQVLKIDVPYVDDGRQHTYDHFNTELKNISVELFSPSGERLTGGSWQASDHGFMPYYYVLRPEKVVKGRYRAVLKLVLMPFGELVGEQFFEVDNALFAAKK
jgi:hypothetical protein